MTRTRTITTEWYGKIKLELWPHGDLEIACGDNCMYESDCCWETIGQDSGYPECDGSSYVFENFEDMPNLFYFFDAC